MFLRIQFDKLFLKWNRNVDIKTLPLHHDDAFSASMIPADNHSCQLKMENFACLQSALQFTVTYDTFTFETLEDQVETLIKLGVVVSNHTALIAPSNRQKFLENLSELCSNLAKISNICQEKFKFLKSFNIEYPAYAEQLRHIVTLNRFMQDTLTHTSPDSVEVFQEACRRTSPLSCSYALLSFLDQDFSSEIIKEMDLNTFEEWRGLINTVFSKLFFLEAYSNGLFLRNNSYSPKILAEKIKVFLSRIDGSRENNESGYWPKGVEELIHSIRYNNAHLDNSEKADLLRDALAKMFKYDSFYCVVFNRCNYGSDFAYDGDNSQIICSLQPEWCSILVYRSRDWKRSTQQERDLIKRETEACRTDVIPWWKSYTGFPSLMQKNHIQNTGFVGIIRHSLAPSVRSINSDSGPGNWIHAINKTQGEKMILIAGFK